MSHLLVIFIDRALSLADIIYKSNHLTDLAEDDLNIHTCTCMTLRNNSCKPLICWKLSNDLGRFEFYDERLGG